MSVPYKLDAYEPGAVSVIDRESGERAGYALQDFHENWQGYAVWKNTRHAVGIRKYRKDAVAEVWRMYVRLVEETPTPNE